MRTPIAKLALGAWIVAAFAVGASTGQAQTVIPNGNTTTFRYDQDQHYAEASNASGMSYNGFWGWTANMHQHCGDNQPCNQGSFDQGRCILVTKPAFMSHKGLIRTRVVFSATEDKSLVDPANYPDSPVFKVYVKARFGSVSVEKSRTFHLNNLTFRHSAPDPDHEGRTLVYFNTPGAATEVLPDIQVPEEADEIVVSVCEDQAFNLNLQRIEIDTIQEL